MPTTEQITRAPASRAGGTRRSGRELNETVSQAIFYVLFRMGAIEDLAGPERALEWARSMVEDDELRHAFSARLLEDLDARKRLPE